MFGKKRIAVLALSIFSFCASLAFGKGADFTVLSIDRSEEPAFTSLGPDPIVLAQNDNTASDDNEKSKSESETSESEPAADDKNKSSEAKSKPLEPFLPSEKIPGEQAVDFPVDI